MLILHAPAKINLSLDVLGRSADGYHDLVMPTHAAEGFCDEIRLRLLDSPVFAAFSNKRNLPRGDRNLAVTAARLFLSKTGRLGMGADIEIIKRIPVSAGLGGGSSDAAAVLSGLNRHFGNEISDGLLREWGLELGSDVPFCLMGGTALVEGRGEKLTSLPPLPFCRILLCRPPTAVSTRAAFAAFKNKPHLRRPDTDGLVKALHKGDLRGVAMRMFNVFEEQVAAGCKDIPEIRAAMTGGGALGVSMSGTGATMFGLFSDEALADAAYTSLKQRYRDTFLA